MIQIAWTAMQTSNPFPFPRINTPVVCRYHAKLAFMIAGTHHHPRSLNLFLVFLSVNMGVLFFPPFFLFFPSSFGVNWRIGSLYEWRFAHYFSLFTTFILSFDFLLIFFPALLG